MSVKENKEAIRRLINIFNAYDFSRLDEVCDDDVVYRTASGLELHGLDAFRDVMNQTHHGFPDFEYSIEELFGEGDRVHCTYRFTGTHEGEFFDIPASGNRADYPVAAVFEVVDGKIVEEFDFYDGLTFMRVVGVLSEEVRPGGKEWPSGGAVLRPQ